MDLDGDGFNDLLSGSWPGEIFFFKGGPNRTFAAPTKLLDRDGKAINVGGGIRKEADGSILITGDAKFEKDKDGKTIVIYNGETIPVAPDKEVAITGCASALHVCDWNGDGKLDLLIGEIGGSVHLLLNQARDKGYSYGKSTLLEVAGKPLRVDGDAGPFVADWDADGKPDLLVGCADGSVAYFRNVGTRTEPKLEARVNLIPEARDVWNPTSSEAKPGVRTKVCVYDYNGDGKLDLLVGDFTMQKPVPQEFSAEQKAEHEKLKKEQADLNQQRMKLINNLRGPNRLKDEAELKKASDEMQKLTKRYTEVYRLLPKEAEDHGYVWLYLRK